MLETRGNPKEEVKGGILLSASTSSDGGGMRSSMGGGSHIGRSGSSLPMDASLAIDKMGMTALHRAAAEGDAEVVRELLASHAALLKAVCRLSGWTALDYAVHADRLEVAKLLLAAGPPVATKRALHLVRSAEVKREKALLSVFQFALSRWRRCSLGQGSARARCCRPCR